MESYTQPTDEIKARLDSPQTVSALAQLVALHVANGTTSTKRLAELTGYTDRAIRHAKAEAGCRKKGKQVAEPAMGCRENGNRLPPVPRAPARIETPSGLVIPKGVSEVSPLPPGERVALVSGELRICAELRVFWLEQFGGDEQRLNLALIQAAGYVQSASSKPLEAQVSSQLARMASDKRDRDMRHAAAVDRNKAAPRMTAKEAKLAADRELMISLGVL
jgi:hypothetical protein